MKYRGNLTKAIIVRAIAAGRAELERAGIEDKICMAYRLALEEVLLIYREKLGEDTSFTLRYRKKGGDLVTRLTVAGESVDPFAEKSEILNSLAERARNTPVWSYEKNKNRVDFVFTLYNTTWKNIRFSWKYTVNSRKTLGLSLLSQLLSAGLSIVAPMVSARIIVAYTQHEATRVIYIALALMIIQLLRNLFLVLSNQGYNRAYCRTLSNLEKDLVNSALRVESQCMDEKGSGLFIQRITTDTQRIASGFNNIADMITQALNYIGVLCAMVVVHPLIALFVIVILGAQYMLEIRRTKRLYKDDRVYRIANERFSGLVGEMVRGEKDVKLMNCEERFSTELEERISDANDKRLSMQTRSWNAKLFRWEIGEVGSFAMISLLAALISMDKLSLSMALVLYNYYSDLGPNAIKVIGNFMDSIADFNVSNERVHALLNSPEFPKEHFGSTELPSPRGEIVFDHVRFSYHPEDRKFRNVLEDMCFTVRPGEMVGLVGKSGCGKSTTFNLLSRLYTPTGGRILFDGIDLQELSRDAVRSNMTVVTQNPYIFRMSVRENLKLVKPDLTEEEMRDVCRQACIDEDIQNMPGGYDAMIGEGGVNLSGGQRQRLAIARCMLRDSRIILFDEATSALDNTTQAKIQEAIDHLRQSRTVIIIAHRLSTIAGADRILYMQDGRILAEGKHEELLKTCEPYQTLASMEKANETEG